jgi:HlyD family secretion protein
MMSTLPERKNLQAHNLASLRSHAWAGIGTLALLLTCVGGWMGTTSIAGAVVASGFVSVAGGSKQIQHAEGGIVKEIVVRDGDVVKAGDVLVRLDDVVVQSELSIVTSQLRDALARQGRLYAESVQSDSIVLPALAIDWPADPELSALLGDQARLYESRKASLAGQKDQLQQQILQRNEQISGLLVQQAALTRQASLLSADEQRLLSLLQRGLMESSRVSEIQRSRAEVDGASGQITALIAATRASVAELELGHVQLTENFQTQVLQELADVRQLTQELLQRRAAASDRLQRLEIRSPVDGMVYQSAVHTVGGVVSAGDTIMEVVPGGNQLTLEVRLSPLDVDKVYVGQGVAARFSGLDPRDTPELSATVSSIAPDLTRDPGSGAQFYEVRVAVGPSEPAKLPDDTTLVPGMPTDVYIYTGDRTVLSYLFSPLYDQMSRALRE